MLLGHSKLKMQDVYFPAGFALIQCSFGGLLAGHVTNTGPGGWRTIFWIQAGLHVATALGFFAFYWPVKRSSWRSMSFKEYVWMCDPFGSFFFMSGTVLMLLALNWAGGVYEWRDPHIAAPFAIGTFLFIMFCLYGMLCAIAGG